MAKKQDNATLWILAGIGAYMFFRKPAQAVPVVTPTLTLPRPADSPRATTGTISLSGSTFVKWYQAALNYLISANLNVDGIAGPLTMAAVKTFQAQWGIEPTGIVDPATEYYLHSAMKEPGYIEKPYEY